MKDVRAFLVLEGYYRKFIPGFEKTAEPLHSLLNKSNKLEYLEYRVIICGNRDKKEAFGSPIIGISEQ